LPLRTPQPLALAPEQTGSSWGIKLAFFGAIAAAGFIAYRKRKAKKPEDKKVAVKVLGKTAMGLRGELALVEVGGMRLLVGVTSSSMQTLAVLPDDADFEMAPAIEEKAEKSEKVEVGTRARSLLAELEGTITRTPPKTLAVAPAPAAFSASRYEKARTARDDDDAPESAPAPPRRRAPRAPREMGDRDSAVAGQARGIALALRGVK